jgi:AMMECR1 domain-containing protein
MPLSPTDRQILLSLAREAIAHHLRGETPPLALDTLPDPLTRDGASFVTLTKHGALRGCTGRPARRDIRVERPAAARLRRPR